VEVDTPAVIEFDEAYVDRNTRIYVVAPDPAPTPEKIHSILEDYKKIAFEIWQEELKR
jgi:hypothetical protein